MHVSVVLYGAARVVINNARPDPDATLATTLHHKDQVALLVAVAGGQNRAPGFNPDR